MSLLSLQELSFYKSCVTLWSHSQLPSIAAKAIYKGEEMEVLEVDETVMDDVEKYLVNLKTPTKTKRKLLSAISGLTSELNRFIYEMSRQFCSDKNYFRQLKYCVENVIFTEKAMLDRAGTLCNIMRQSKFKVRFVPSFLQHYFVEPSTVDAIFKEVECNESTLGKSEEYMKKFTKRMDKIAWYVFYLKPGNSYWENQNEQDRIINPKSIPHHSHRTDFRYAIAKSEIDAMKHYYDLSYGSIKLITRHYYISLEEVMFENAKYMFQTNSQNAESIVFFYERLSPISWAGILFEEFQCIFLALLTSWRHRHLCMQFYHEADDTQDYNTTLDLLREISQMLDNQKYKYDFHDILNIAEQLWSKLSCKVKADPEAKYSLIPKLVLPRNHFDALTVFLNDYTVETQEDIVGNILFNLMFTSEDQIEACLKATQDLGLETKDPKDFITMDRLKNYLIYKARCPQGDYHKLSKYMYLSESEEKELKENLLHDKHFIVDFFVNSSGDVTDFLNWALTEASNIRVFKDNLVAHDLISAIYERRLLELASVKEAGKVFRTLQLTINEKGAERKKVKECPTLVQWVLLNFTESPSSFGFDPYTEKEFMADFLSLPETLDAIYDMILDLPHFESSYECYDKGPALVLKWFRFGEKYLNKYSFQLYGNVPPEEVYSACYKKLQRHPRWRDIEKEYAMSIIERRFRCFDLALVYECADTVEEGRFFDCVYSFKTPFMLHFERYLTIYNDYYNFH